MRAKQLLFREDARFAIVRGVSEMAKAVKATLSPKGRHVLLERKPGAPLITKDGVAVVHELDLPDPYENMGVQLVREVAQQTGEIAGDGTTTATVLAEAILREGVKHVVAGASPTELKIGLDQAVVRVERELAALSKPCRSQQEIARVGTVSANGDPVLGHMIAQAMEQVGRDGLITVEDGSGLETTLEVVEGMRFDRGYLSPSFVTDRERMEAVLENPAILLCDQTLTSVDSLVPLLEMMAQQAQSLLVIADSVEGEALAALVMNKLRGRLQVAAVKTPGYGERRKALLEDVAVFTGGQVVSSERGMTIQAVKFTDLGWAKWIRVTQSQTAIFEGGGERHQVDARLMHIENHMKAQVPDAERRILQERLASLRGRVAVIRVGAATETELKEKRARLDDALHATRAAVEEGIVPGGGVAFLRCAPVLEALRLKGDQQIGVEVVRQALEEPLRQIAANAGYAGSVVLNRVREREWMIGFDADAEIDTDMLAAGIIDPTRVMRSALTHAAGLAGLMLTSEVMVTDLPDEEQSRASAGADNPEV